MRRVIAFVVTLLALSLSISAQAQTRKVPHYFPEGIETIQDSFGQWEAYTRYLNTMDGCSQASFWLSSGSSPKVMKVERVIEGKKVRFIFDPWIKSEDGGHIYFFDFCGQQKEITSEQFNVVTEDYIAQAIKAMDASFDFYSKHEEQAVSVSADALGISEGDLRKILDQKVPEAPNVTYRELLYLPKKAPKSDFIPNEVHLGYISALGEAWLNTGIVYTSLEARIVDSLYGKPLVMTHEFIHANPNLQSLPMAEAVDVELMASIPEMLFPEDKISVGFHGYMRLVREWVYVFFGFDFRQVRKEVLLFEHDKNLRIDVKKFNEYYGKLEEAKAELMRFFGGPKGAMAQFYGKQVFWASMNDKLKDSRGVFSILMAMNYAPTILCDDSNPPKCGEGPTTKWLNAHDPEIRQMAEESFRESGTPLAKGEQAAMVGPQAAKLMELAEVMGLTQQDALALAKKYHLSAEDLKGKSASELTTLFFEIMQREKRGKER